MVNISLLEEIPETKYEKHTKQFVQELKINNNVDSGKPLQLLLNQLPEILKSQHAYEQVSTLNRLVCLSPSKHLYSSQKPNHLTRRHTLKTQ